MILGDSCTRRCGFCAVDTGRGQAVDAEEPERVARAASELGLSYVVVTSVARDDLEDEGASHFARTIRALKGFIPGVRVEVLTPDFHARQALIEVVLDAGPDVYNHNLETVRRLQRKVRPQADYERSIEVLRTVKRLVPDAVTKSGLMLGLGEGEDEFLEAAGDLRRAGCDILTVGQYLRPTLDHLEVAEYVSPERFEVCGKRAKQMGFLEVFSGPYVRSSYHAGESFLTAMSFSPEAGGE
jgi:lipoic acid synthetase